MTDPIKLALVYGSTREGRFCDVVARWAASEIERDPAFTLRVVDPGTIELPTRLGQARSAVRQAFEADLAEADAFVVVTPEYNHGYPAALKSLIDAFGAPWRAKPVAFIAYGGISGGLRAVEQLRLVFAELHAVAIRDSVSFADAWTKFDAEGRLLQPEGPREAMATMLRRLRWWALALREARAARAYDEEAAG